MCYIKRFHHHDHWANWVIQTRIQRQSHEGGGFGRSKPPFPVWVELDPRLYDRVSGGFNPPLVWLT